MLPQVEHEYPTITVPTPPCLIVRLANFMTDDEIARARDGYIVTGVPGTYFEFVRTHLQGCLVGRTVLIFPSKVKFLPCKFFFHISAW